MRCGGCGNQEAGRIRILYHDGKRHEFCDKCGGLGSVGVPDVFCPGGGYFDENLADREHPKGQFVHGKRHKAMLLKKLNRAEWGDAKNPVTGKVTPYIKDPEKRRRYCIENFGG